MHETARGTRPLFVTKYVSKEIVVVIFAYSVLLIILTNVSRATYQLGWKYAFKASHVKSSTNQIGYERETVPNVTPKITAGENNVVWASAIVLQRSSSETRNMGEVTFKERLQVLCFSLCDQRHLEINSQIQRNVRSHNDGCWGAVASNCRGYDGYNKTTVARRKHLHFTPIQNQTSRWFSKLRIDSGVLIMRCARLGNHLIQMRA